MGGYPVSITRTLLASVAAGSSTLQAYALQLSSWMQKICERPSLHTVLSILGVWYQDQSILLTPELCAKKEEKRDVLMSSYQMPHSDYFFSLMATGQNLQYGGRALFPLFIYLYNICTDFLLNMKDELTSGMPENTEVILFACFSIWGFFFFFNNKSGIFWYCFKIIIEVFQHFTLSNFLSCGNSLSLIFMSPDVLVQIRFSHIFLTALNFYLK